jgi:hypothetical protein
MTPAEKKLLAAWRKLTPAQQLSVMDFAGYLAQREPPADAPQISATPLDIPKPHTESVVKAIKRLRETYPMLEHSKLLHETSHFMTLHLVKGKSAAEVIEELEKMFARHYQAHIGTSS